MVVGFCDVDGMIQNLHAYTFIRHKGIFVAFVLKSMQVNDYMTFTYPVIYSRWTAIWRHEHYRQAYITGRCSMVPVPWLPAKANWKSKIIKCVLNYRPISAAQCLPFSGGNNVHAVQLWECKRIFIALLIKAEFPNMLARISRNRLGTQEICFELAWAASLVAWQLFTAEPSVPNVLLALEKWPKLPNLVVPVDLCAFNLANFFSLLACVGVEGKHCFPVMCVVLWYEGIHFVKCWRGIAYLSIHWRKAMPNVDKELILFQKALLLVAPDVAAFGSS